MHCGTRCRTARRSARGGRAPRVGGGQEQCSRATNSSAEVSATRKLCQAFTRVLAAARAFASPASTSPPRLRVAVACDDRRSHHNSSRCSSALSCDARSFATANSPLTSLSFDVAFFSCGDAAKNDAVSSQSGQRKDKSALALPRYLSRVALSTKGAHCDVPTRPRHTAQRMTGTA